MRTLTSIILSASIALFASTSMAETTTSMQDKWICTTNASSSSVPAEQTADSEMQKNAKSAAKAFGFAAKNCRDCTKISCEVQTN